MKKTITGLIILGLGIGFPACLGIFLIETQNAEDGLIEGNKDDNFPQKEELSNKDKIGDFIKAIINVDPNVLNLKSKGKWITVYITLTKGYDASYIVINSIILNELISVGPKFEIIDFNNDNCLDLMVKFNRTLVQNVVEPQEVCTIIITGDLIDGKIFKGTDIIKLIHF